MGFVLILKKTLSLRTHVILYIVQNIIGIHFKWLNMERR